MLTDVEGIAVGHWSDPEARTGCTVVLCPNETVASGEIRGGAPATREFSLLDPMRLVRHVDAVVLCGGSAFGLASAQGVVDRLEAQERGHPTTVGPVPIVVAMGIFDLGVGDSSVRPGPAEGAAAFDAADSASLETGAVGAGCGATTGKWRGSEHARPSGLGSATMRRQDLIVAALVVVNAVGSIDDGTSVEDPGAPASVQRDQFGATTLGVVATNADIDKGGCHLVAQSSHDGFARALFPSHTRGDGDAVVALATGTVEADLESVRVLAQQATTKAIRSLAG